MTSTAHQEHDTEQGGHGRYSGLLNVVMRKVDGIPLTVKLVACMLVLLAVGTFGISFTIRQLVGDYLMEKTDNQLRDQAPLIYNNAKWLDQRRGDGRSSGIPNDYFLQYRDMENRIIYTPLLPTLKDDVLAEPDLPENGSMGSVKLGEPFTAQSKLISAGPTANSMTLQKAKAPWRVLALARQDKRDDGTLVTTQVVYIGLSMSDQIDVVGTLTRDALLLSVGIVLIGGVVGSLLVRRTLDPLKRIEKTAAKIANGDLGQRVPTAPANTEVGSLASSLNAMLARIEQSFKEQRVTTEKMKQFVSDASHELRTPLAAIHGYAELYTMQRQMPGALERADTSIAHIEDSSSRMTVLVEDLLSLARLDEGRGVDTTQTVELHQMLGDAVDDLHALDPKRDIHRGTLAVAPQIDGQPSQLVFKQGRFPDVELQGDGSRLRQVATNIVGNIHRYTPADSLVEVGLNIIRSGMGADELQDMEQTSLSLEHFLDMAVDLHEDDPGRLYAVMMFRDHGPGVPEEKQSQIFERFYTADPSRAREKGGTGLGMSIAKSVVHAHHGFICAGTTPGGGLTLTMILPVALRGSQAVE